MNIKHFWSEDLLKLASSTANLLIESEAVLKGYTFLALTVNLTNEDKKNCLLEIGKTKLGTYYPIIKCRASANNYSFAAPIQFVIVNEGVKLYGVVHEPADKNKCVLSFSGIIFKNE